MYKGGNNLRIKQIFYTFVLLNWLISNEQRAYIRNRTYWQTACAVLHSGHYRHDDYFVVQHHRQHFHRSWRRSYGIAGLAITFPLMNLVVAFCTMVSAGGSTIHPSGWDRKTWTELPKSWETHWCSAWSMHSYSAASHSYSWMIFCASSVPAMIRCHMPATHAGDITGYPRHLYHDWPEQYHACHGISQESDAYVYGNGSL